MKVETRIFIVHQDFLPVSRNPIYASNKTNVIPHIKIRFCHLTEIFFLSVLFQITYFPVTLSRGTFVCSDNFVAFYNEIKRTEETFHIIDFFFLSLLEKMLLVSGRQPIGRVVAPRLRNPFYFSN